MLYIYRQYGSSSYMKVIGSRSRSQEQRRSKIPIRANVKLLSVITTVWGTCSVRFSDITDGVTAIFVTWPELTSLNKCTHSRVVGIRLEGRLVDTRPTDLTQHQSGSVVLGQCFLCNVFWRGEFSSLNVPLDTIGHFGDESSQAINYTGTDNKKVTN